ncbi:hypothetical protein BX070DRAFT_2598 [Coemansia spiralis]|nr:hypothetical protein BX070DRAFT_2598 [Coemansia spiralis]
MQCWCLAVFLFLSRQGWRQLLSTIFGKARGCRAPAWVMHEKQKRPVCRYHYKQKIRVVKIPSILDGDGCLLSI